MHYFGIFPAQRTDGNLSSGMKTPKHNNRSLVHLTENFQNSLLLPEHMADCGRPPKSSSPPGPPPLSLLSQKGKASLPLVLSLKYLLRSHPRASVKFSSCIKAGCCAPEDGCVNISVPVAQVGDCYRQGPLQPEVLHNRAEPAPPCSTPSRMEEGVGGRTSHTPLPAPSLPSKSDWPVSPSGKARGFL